MSKFENGILKVVINKILNLIRCQNENLSDVKMSKYVWKNCLKKHLTGILN